MSLILKETLTTELINIPIIIGQILQCTDSNDIYVDTNDNIRTKFDNIQILNSESDREGLLTPFEDIIYFVKETTNLYKFSNVWYRINEKILLEKLAIESLTPTTVTKNNVSYAPRTLADIVFMPDGSTVTEALEDMITDKKRFVIQTDTEHVMVQYDKQSIFDIPYPFSTYDYTKFPIILLLNNNKLDVNEYYVTEDDQIILSPLVAEKVTKGDILTYIFNYHTVIYEDIGINAEYVNNVRFFVSPTEPHNKQPEDVWFDTFEKSIKQFDGLNWTVIVKSGSGEGGGTSFAVKKNTAVVIDSTTFVEIGIPEYDKNRDLLFVFKNSVYLEESDDYTVTDDSRSILAINDIWNGTDDNIVFNFLVLQNSGTSGGGGTPSGEIDGSSLKQESVQFESLSPDLLNKLNPIDDMGVSDRTTWSSGEILTKFNRMIVGLRDVTLLPNGWNFESSSNMWRYDHSDYKIDVPMSAEVIVHPQSYQAATDLAPINYCSGGYISIYAYSKPTEEINIDIVLSNTSLIFVS